MKCNKGVASFNIIVEFNINGRSQTHEYIDDAIRNCIYDSFPSVIIDDEENDCIVFTDSIEVHLDGEYHDV